MPDFVIEQSRISGGCKFVAGVDEAGRGPLAGPVVAAAVVLNPLALPEGLDDSKKLTAALREVLFQTICASAHVAIVSAPPRVIETRNIRGATLWAMARAVAMLPVRADYALIDGRDIPPGLTCDAEAVIGGDARCSTIAAASVVAKVARDMMCPIMDADSPGYGFSAHKGYGTAHHIAALKNLGPTPHHRQTFRPVAELLQSLNPTA